MMLNVYCPEKVSNEIRWLFLDILNPFMDCFGDIFIHEHENVTVVGDDGGGISFDVSALLVESEQWLEGKWRHHWQEIEVDELSLDEETKKKLSSTVPVIKSSSEYDYLSSLFFLLSRYEEALDYEGDRFDRFSSEQCSHRPWLDQPIADEIKWIFFGLLKKGWPELKVPHSEFRIVPSHDIDHPSIYFASPLWRHCFGVARHGAPLKAALCWVISIFGVRNRLVDPYDTLEWIIQESDKRGLQSAFYYIPIQTHDKKDPPVNMESERLRVQWANIDESGHEIGLHPGFETYQNNDLICKSKETLQLALRKAGLEHVCVQGGRQHYLRWKTPQTAQLWAKAGMQYDSTLGFADKVGFRCGTCFPYKMYDVVERTPIALVQRPLVLMDCSLMNRAYEGLGRGPRALEKAVKLKEACKKVGGEFTLLWHNTRLIRNDERRLYLSILDA